MNKFAGKAAFVTGGGEGIDYALCRAYVGEGAMVALNNIDAALANRAAQTITVDGGWTLPSPIPAGHPDQPEHSSQLR